MPLDIVYVNREHRVVSIKKLGCIHGISENFMSGPSATQASYSTFQNECAKRAAGQLSHRAA